MYEIARCAGPGCDKPLTRLATGRPRTYCGPNCRQAAKRERDRQAGTERARAAQLEEATAVMNRLWRPLEESGFCTVADFAALVVSCAADLERPPGELDQALTGLRAAVDGLASTASQYRQAAGTAAELRHDTQAPGQLPGR